MTVPPLRLVALEITRTCSLSCLHCRGDSGNHSYPDELSLDEIKGLFENIESFARPIMILTGGEPLGHPDILEIASISSSHGFRTVLATCGHLLDRNMAEELIKAGVRRISVSIDGADAKSHDDFRGMQGAFELSLKGLEAARLANLEFQINTTVTSVNASQIEDIHSLALELGAAAFHPFLLVPMGRGVSLESQALGAHDYELMLERIAKLEEHSPIEVQPTCAPHFVRFRKKSNKKGGHTGGCLGGKGFVFVSHTGKVQICGFLEIEAGDIRKNGGDLAGIWNNSELFLKLRNPSLLKGKCGICPYRSSCGGCRARAWCSTGDYCQSEPNCIYEPGRKK